MNPSELARIAGAMVAKGKGILAADESTGTIKKRFDTIRLESTAENRRAYRDLLFTAPAAAESISGVIDIAEDIPTDFAIAANAQALARYAALCQENDIVPIVEPEVLMDGAHTLDRCAEVTEHVLQSVFGQLFEQRVLLECMVLKPNMVISGKKAANRAPPQTVAEATVRVLKRHVPPAVPGIAFLSGGQSPAEATLHLSLINKLGPLPWSITFSYGRALQDEALKAWGGTAANFASGQKEFVRRAKLTALATTGRYASDMESQAA